MLGLRRKEDGAAAVEFAIVGSLLFMLLFGIIEFGIVFNRFQGLQAGGREGARFASLSQTKVGEVMDRIRSSVSLITTSVGAPTEVCPVDAPAGHYCVTLARTPAAGGAAINYTTVGCTITGTMASPCTAALRDTQPCALHSGDIINVTVTYRQKITIPLWASPTITMLGNAQFTCE